MEQSHDRIFIFLLIDTASNGAELVNYATEIGLLSGTFDVDVEMVY